MAIQTNDRITTAMELLEEGIRALAESGQWERYLKFQASFHKYSFSNTVLIHSQCPDATRTAGLKTWNKLGRQVMKGQKAIWILAPVTVRNSDQDDDQEETTKRIVSSRPVPVFDVSQTEGDDLPTVARKLEGDTAGNLFGKLANFSAKNSCPVFRATIEQVNGFYDPKHHTITISDDLTPDQACKTLAHEIAHSILHRDIEVYREHRGDCELEAESTAYIVLNHFGIDSGSYSFGYVTAWQGGDDNAIKSLKTCAHRIQATAKSIIEGVTDLGDDR